MILETEDNIGQNVTFFWENELIIIIIIIIMVYFSK